MKISKIAILAATVAAMGLAPVTYAQTTGKTDHMDAIKTMDTNKDGMITKDEFMRMMGAKFDAMDKNKTGAISYSDVSKIIYSFNP
jgi:Ca2+-binding EF-hand superfamily protein